MADQKFEELAHIYKGQEYTFIGQLEVSLREMECPICRQILSEPLQTSCGHLLCKGCHGALQGDARTPWNAFTGGGSMGSQWGSERTRRGVQCPVCRQEHTMGQDKFNERRVRNLQVRCINHKEGCSWVGNLGDEEHHRKKCDGCQYEEIECPHRCGDTMHRMAQSQHLSDCPRRPHSCEYCGGEGPYQHIVGDHLETCCKYPVQCPNGCEGTIPREDVVSEIKLKKDLHIMHGRLQAKEERVSELMAEVAAKNQRIHALEMDTRPLHMRDLERDNEAKTARIHQLEGTNQELQRANQAKTDSIHDLETDATQKAVEITQLTEANGRLKREMSDIQETLSLLPTRSLPSIFALIAICVILEFLF